MFLWKEKLQPLSLLDVQENNQSISFKAEKASVAHGTGLSGVFLLELTLGHVLASYCVTALSSIM